MFLSGMSKFIFCFSCKSVKSCPVMLKAAVALLLIRLDIKECVAHKARTENVAHTKVAQHRLIYNYDVVIVRDADGKRALKPVK